MALNKYDVAALSADNIRNDNFLQRLFLTWVYPVVGKGQKGTLQPSELRMPSAQATEVASLRFQKEWEKELQVVKEGGEPSLVRALRRAFWKEFVVSGIFKLMWGAFVILGAYYFVRSLVSYATDPAVKKNDWNTNDSVANQGVGWILACFFFLDSILIGISLQRMGDASIRLGIKMRAALMTEVFRKTFRLEQQHNEDSGNVVSLVSTDCLRLYEGVQHLHNVWTAPLETAAIIALLLSLTQGVYGLPALGIVIFVLPMQYYFGYKIAMFKSENVTVSDNRVLRMHEILLAIKLVKFYVWEKPFAAQVAEIRAREVLLLQRAARIKTINLCMVFAVPPIIALVIFALYTSKAGALTSELAFVVLSLFNTLRLPLVVLPKALRGSSEAVSSVARLQSFLLLPESQQSERSTKVEARLTDAVLSHPADPDDFKLVVPRFEVKAGEVAAVVGRVGTGKSSLFHAILGNMKLESGEMFMGGKVAYVPQTPWVQNLTLRDNILFGLPFDEARYKACIHACALELDLQILPNGDQSMAGERGINLSGGQRQRVCLARAVYHDCDLVLLDNPLSAVDQHTSKHIFDNCIKGMLKKKAVVLIAHQLELLPQCDKIAIMDGGKVQYFGGYDPEALNRHMPVDHMLYATVEAGESATAAPKGGQPERRSLQRSDTSIPHVDSIESAMNKMAGNKSPRSHGHGHEEKAALIEDDNLEESQEAVASQFNGTTARLNSRQAAYVYWSAGGRILGVFSLLVFMTTQTCRILSDLWIRYWASDYYKYLRDQGYEEGNKEYLLSYMGFVIGFIILLLCRDSTFSFWSKTAATNLHNQLFKRVLQAPILFFLRTPVGDVLNSFAKDQDTVDETMSDTIHMTTIYLMILLTSLAIVTVSIYYYAALTAALFLAFFLMQHIYLPAATLLKRWAGETANNVFVHVDESLHGIDVIRAFDAVNYFIQENVHRVNLHHLALFNTEQTHLWLAFWCDFFGAILVVATCLFSVALRAELGPAAVGLAISNSIQVLVFFTWVVRGVADTVSMWDAVERITSYATNVPTEVDDADADADDETQNKALPAAGAMKPLTNGKSGSGATANVVLLLEDVKVEDTAMRGAGGVLTLAEWPTAGDIKFDGVCLRYFPGAPLALRHVSFHIKDKEKVGVVGRTGSGKTTLLMALFRMFKLAGGRIIIDGVDIEDAPLREVRKRIAIIPQEPVMFKGTVRTNLDPFGECMDAQIWEALTTVSMRMAVAEMGGLDSPVAEGGSNFSLGQKQLICMARCVLKKTRILVLDEATAAMDLQTDSLIQRTIRRVFKDRTTITIAHRLDTIIFSDKILAMASGRMKEFDTPTTLLQNPRSMFNMLVEDTGPHASAALKRMAAQGPPVEETPVVSRRGSVEQHHQ